MNETLKPIYEQIGYWIYYKENCPNYYEDPKGEREFRKANDRDCVLTDGDLQADTIFSLWGPLRHVLRHLNPNVGRQKFSKSVPSLKKIKENLPKYLPPEHPMVIELSKLFVLGQTRANVMLLPPNRNMNGRRGRAPYYDYVPHFLHDSFRPTPGTPFPEFESNEHLTSWIKREHLEMFFDGKIARENIIDLLECGSEKSPAEYSEENLYAMFSSYIRILAERQKYFEVNS